MHMIVLAFVEHCRTLLRRLVETMEHNDDQRMLSLMFLLSIGNAFLIWFQRVLNQEVNYDNHLSRALFSLLVISLFWRWYITESSGELFKSKIPDID